MTEAPEGEPHFGDQDADDEVPVNPPNYVPPVQQHPEPEAPPTTEAPESVQ